MNFQAFFIAKFLLESMDLMFKICLCSTPMDMLKKSSDLVDLVSKSTEILN